MYVAFIYTPSLDSVAIEALLVAIQSNGATISHLGKSDPPRKWTRSLQDAIAEVANGPNLTNTTFIRASQRNIGITIDQHRDERWTHDTISIDGPDEVALRNMASTIGNVIGAYLVITGTQGGGKNQDWNIVSRSPECPPGITM